jgi:hypothetical protein
MQTLNLIDKRGGTEMFFKTLKTALVLFVGLFILSLWMGAVHANAGFFDDGRDYMAASEWDEFTLFDQENLIAITDTANRLNFTSLGVSPSSDAEPFRSFSSKWYLETDQDFWVRVKYNYTIVGSILDKDVAGLELGVYNYAQNPLHTVTVIPQYFGIGAQNDVSEFNGTTYNINRYYAGANTDLSDDALDVESWSNRSASEGYFEIRYMAEKDLLKLSASEFNAQVGAYLPVFSFDYSNVAALDIEKMGVNLGGWTDGIAMASGDAYFSDFQVLAGSPVVTPEPISSLLFVLGGAGFITRKYLKK